MRLLCVFLVVSCLLSVAAAQWLVERQDTGATAARKAPHNAYEREVTGGCSSNLDVGVTDILFPTGSVESGAVFTPRALVHNFGTNDAIFPVQMRIGANYAAVVSETLAAGMTDTVEFLWWIAQPVGVHSVVCFTALAGDENPRNDTIVDSVRVSGSPFHDVGTVAILLPDSIHPGDSVVPSALIANLGTVEEHFFDVRFRIGIEYNRTATLTSAIAPGDTVPVSFPMWVAVIGVHTTSCSTMLFSDLNRANDKLTVMVSIGISESDAPYSRSAPAVPTVVRHTLCVRRTAAAQHNGAYVLLDLDGRKVMDLEPGPNDVRHLAAGVYFVRAVSRELSAASCHKVVIQR